MFRGLSSFFSQSRPATIDQTTNLRMTGGAQVEEEGVVARKPYLEGPGVTKPFFFRKMTIFLNEAPSVIGGANGPR